MAAATDAWPEPRDWRERTADDGDPPVRDDGVTGPERADVATEPNPQPPDGYEPI